MYSRTLTFEDVCQEKYDDAYAHPLAAALAAR